MEYYGAGLHERPSLMREIKLGEQEIVMDARKMCGLGKEFPERLRQGADLQIKGNIEIKVSP